MPTTPETYRRIVVGHAARHIFKHLNAVGHGPESEKAPNDKEL